MAPDDLPDDGSEAIGIPEDARWFLSKLVRPVQPDSGDKVWQRLRGDSVPSVEDRRHRPPQWKNAPSEEDAESAVDNEALSR